MNFSVLRFSFRLRFFLYGQENNDFNDIYIEICVEESIRIQS